MGPKFSSLPVHGIVSWSSGNQGGFHQTHPDQHLGLIAVLLSCIIPQQCQSSLEEDAHPVFVSDDFLFASNDLYVCLLGLAISVCGKSFPSQDSYSSKTLALALAFATIS